MLENRQTARRILTTAVGAILVSTIIGIWMDWRAHERAHVVMEQEGKDAMQIHKKMMEFMAAGNRFAASQEFPDINNVGALLQYQENRVKDAIAGKVDTIVPQSVVLERIENNSKKLDQNSAKLDEIERLLRK